MKQMQIFEPAMCCPTGLCGVGVDPELLRLSTVLDTLKKSGVTVDRFNLSSAPMKFVTTTVVNEFINAMGPEGLPVVLVDGKLVLTGRYPSNEELIRLLDLPAGVLTTSVIKVPRKAQGGCDCKGGCC